MGEKNPRQGLSEQTKRGVYDTGAQAPVSSESAGYHPPTYPLTHPRDCRANRQRLRGHEKKEPREKTTLLTTVSTQNILLLCMELLERVKFDHRTKRIESWGGGRVKHPEIHRGVTRPPKTRKQQQQQPTTRETRRGDNTTKDTTTTAKTNSSNNQRRQQKLTLEYDTAMMCDGTRGTSRRTNPKAHIDQCWAFCAQWKLHKEG